MKAILIIGMGTFGTQIARRMSELRCEVMAVDTNEERINEILPYVTNACIGDCTNEEFMRSLGIRNYDVCIVSIGDNFQNSLETTALLKELGAKKVISRAQNDVQEKFLLRNGADETVYPEKQTAIRIATKEASDDILDAFQIERNVYIYDVRIPKEWNEKTIAGLDVRKKYQLNIIAVRVNGQLTVPMPDMILHAGDDVMVIGCTKDIQRLFRI